MAPLSLLTLPFRSSSTTRSLDESSLPIDDDIYQRCPNLSFNRLELWKEIEEPEHEFVILHMTADSPGATHYLIERRPSEGTSFNSKLRGCEAKDTIIALDKSSLPSFHKANNKIIQKFNEPKPDLYTIFDICNAIRMDPDSEKYTLEEFNCYFFARTLMLLVTRHCALRQYCRIHSPPRNDFGSLSGPQIDAILSKPTSNWSQDLRRFIYITFQESNNVRMILLKF